MKIATIELAGTTPIIQSRYHATPKGDREKPEDYEERTWINKAHINKDGFVFVPGPAVKMALAATAQRISMQVQGKGKATYTKHFVSGVQASGNLILDVKGADIKRADIVCDSDGKRGSGKKVIRFFPQIPSEWQGTIQMVVSDPLITDDIFRYHMIQTGISNGLGSFRVGTGGECGGFLVKSIVWKEVAPAPSLPEF